MGGELSYDDLLTWIASADPDDVAEELEELRMWASVYRREIDRLQSRIDRAAQLLADGKAGEAHDLLERHRTPEEDDWGDIEESDGWDPGDAPVTPA